MDTKNKIAVVTGAAGGLGREIVRYLINEGFSVVATDVSEAQLNELASYINVDEGLVLLPMDVSDIENVRDVASKIPQYLAGEVAVLINNAGIFDRTPILYPDACDRARKIIEVNLLGTYYCTSVFARLMVKNKFGRIVNIGSIAGTSGAAQASAYAASKGGMVSATQSWARELGPFGICVTAIAPGVFATKMAEEGTSRTLNEIQKQLLYFIPVRRLGQPKDIAELVLFLATCESDYLNGAVLELDGGLHTGNAEITQFE